MSHFIGKTSIKLLIINSSTGKVLITKDPGDDIFELPGGRIDDGESVNDCAIRELREELRVQSDGIDLNYVHSEQVMHTRDNSMQMMMAFSIALPSNIVDDIQFSDEVSEMKWVNADNYLDYSYYDDAKRTLDKYFKTNNN